MKTKKILALIPARMGSSRFPGKPMAKINNKPMIEIVYNNVKKSKLLQATYVATCDEIIHDHIKSIGGNSVLTSNTHERASDRCAEALLKIEKILKLKFDIVVMVQGDEPMIHPNMITEATLPMFKNNQIKIVNLMGKIKDHKEFIDRGCIKVVTDLKSNALYFSREPIPTNSKTNNITIQKQICVIPFKRDFLLKYNKLKETPLEKIESIDMLRVLENGIKVFMAKTKYYTHAVDTPRDLKMVSKLIKS